jgi:hypothetical protein
LSKKIPILQNPPRTKHNPILYFMDSREKLKKMSSSFKDFNFFTIFNEKTVCKHINR